MSSESIQCLKTAELRALLNDDSNQLKSVYFVPFALATETEKEIFRIVLRIVINGIERDFTIKTENRKQRWFKSLVRGVEYVRQNYQVDEIRILNRLENDFSTRFQ